MITEAIWTQNHHIKGSSRGAIRNWILDKYTDVDENRIKTHLSSNLSKMLEDDREDHYPCLIRVDNMNYKLTPEWRKEWTKTYNKKRRQTKRKKRPSDHPKHPRNAYLFYATEVRKRRQDEYPDKSFGDLTSLIAKEWRNLSSKKRTRYDELAKKDKRRYHREMKEYEAKSSRSDSDSSSEVRNKRKRSRKSRSESEDSKSHSRKKRKAKSESSESDEKNPKKKEKKTTESEEEKEKEKDKDKDKEKK